MQPGCMKAVSFWSVNRRICAMRCLARDQSRSEMKLFVGGAVFCMICFVKNNWWIFNRILSILVLLFNGWMYSVHLLLISPGLCACSVPFSFRMFAQSREGWLPMCFRKYNAKRLWVVKHHLIIIFTINKTNTNFIKYRMSVFEVSCLWITKQCELPFQCAFLVESLKQRSGNQPADPLIAEAGATVAVTKEKRRPQKLPSPKPTALSLARMVWNPSQFHFKIQSVLISDINWLLYAGLCERSAQAENLKEVITVLWFYYEFTF